MDELVAALYALEEEREGLQLKLRSLGELEKTKAYDRIHELDDAIDKQKSRMTHQKQVDFIQHKIDLLKEMKQPDRDFSVLPTARTLFVHLAGHAYAVYEDGQCDMYELHEDPHPRYNSTQPVYRRRPVPFKGTFNFSEAHAIATNKSLSQQERVQQLEEMLRAYAAITIS
jgi:hypothetical protein